MTKDLPVLRGRGRDTHGTVAAVDTLHLDQGSLLILLVGEANETVAAGLAGLLVGHDLGRLARGETSLEQGDQDELINLMAEVADEDRVFGAAVIAAVNKTTTRSPVEAEDTVGVRNRGAVQLQGLLSSLGGRELNKAVARIASQCQKTDRTSLWARFGRQDLPRMTVADDLNLNLLVH